MILTRDILEDRNRFKMRSATDGLSIYWAKFFDKLHRNERGKKLDEKSLRCFQSK